MSSQQGLCLTPFQRKLLLKTLQQDDLRAEYRRRIQIMLLADEGKSQSQICADLGCSHETARYWISMAQAGKAHQWNEHLMGRPKTVTDEYLNRLQELVAQSPRDVGYPFKRWTANWLGKALAREFGIQVSDRHINRLLKQMGLSTRQKMSAPVEADLDPNNTKNIAIRDLQRSAAQEYVWSMNILQTQ